MTPAEWQQLKILFAQAIEKTPEQRTALLAQLRSKDPELAEELERLLQAHEYQTLPIDTPLFPDDAPLLPDGEMVMGRFHILRFLGRGGMGEVYEANDIHMGRIAIKIVRPDIARNASVLARFRGEAQSARGITNPFVCRIHEFLIAPPEKDRPDLAFLTMEFLEGRTLADRIQDEGAIPWREAESVALQLCQGLQAIHAAQVIHRDLKTRNIMLVPRQASVCPVIMDFGLARQTAAAASAGSFTVPGAVVGTPEYMAPEQFEAGELSPATDIYALGVVLYEMAAGKHPFEASTPIAAAVRRAKRPPSLCSLNPEMPRRWDQVVERCLEYEAADRYSSAQEVADALRRRPFDIATVPQAVIHAPVRHPAAFWVAIAALVLCIAGVIALSVFSYRPVHSPSAVQWYNDGLTALRDGTYLKASRAFERAIGYDHNYALAHARLAVAWSELDFTANAQREMIVASSPDSSRGLSAIDRDYLAAIRSTVTGDFAAAVHYYKRILKELPSEEKTAGYLDLGRAQEKNGEGAAAVESYSTATQLSPEWPGPFLRLAVMESRQGNTDAAEKAFSKAEQLFETKIDYEGLAEVDYQRGFAASATGRLTEARDFTLKSRQAAREIHSVQLEARALALLGAIAYGSGDDEKCIELANQAIDLAQDNRLEYWAIDARIRLANAYTDRLDFQKADDNLENALHAAQQAQHPRLEALANRSLADLRDQQQKPGQTIVCAQRALDYYRKNGFVNESLSLLVLLARAKEQQGNFRESLQGGLEALDVAKRSKNLALLTQVEEAMGQAELRLQQYPAALADFQSALDNSRQTGQQVEFQMMHCADVLWRLGRYAEAEQMLNSIPAAATSQADVASDVNRVWAEMRLSQRNYPQALRFAQRSERFAKDLSPSSVAEIEAVVALTRSQLGEKRVARQLSQQARSLAQQQPNPAILAMANLDQAIVLLHSGSPAEAKPSAEAAHDFFQKSGQRDSEWQSLFWLAKIQAEMGDAEGAKKFSSQALDILSQFEHNWASPAYPAYKAYISRPDIASALGELRLLVRR